MAAFGRVLDEFIALSHGLRRHPGPRFARPGMGCGTAFHGQSGARVALLHGPILRTADRT
jgi:hypothetical protein